MTTLRGHAGSLIAVCALTACSSKSDGASAAPALPVPMLSDLVDVVYVGGPTDESLLHLLVARVEDEPSKRLVLDSPDTSVPAAKELPATIAFHSASQASVAPRRRAPESAERPAWRRLASQVLAFVSPERSAWAHGTPYNGQAYYLVVNDATGKLQLRVFTAQTSYTPDTGTWQKLAGAAQPLTLQATSGFFEENEIPIDGGPFVGGSFQFSIQ